MAPKCLAMIANGCQNKVNHIQKVKWETQNTFEGWLNEGSTNLVIQNCWLDLGSHMICQTRQRRLNECASAFAALFLLFLFKFTHFNRFASAGNDTMRAQPNLVYRLNIRPSAKTKPECRLCCIQQLSHLAPLGCVRGYISTELCSMQAKWKAVITPVVTRSCKLINIKVARQRGKHFHYRRKQIRHNNQARKGKSPAELPQEPTRSADSIYWPRSLKMGHAGRVEWVYHKFHISFIDI